MQVKKYLATNMQEAVKMIKEDLGSKAIIISTKKVKKGSGAFGLFGKPILEVTAARDETATRPAAPKQTFKPIVKPTTTDYRNELTAPPGYPSSRPPSSDMGGKSIRVIKEDIAELKDLMADLRKGVRREVNDQATVTHLRYEISELKGLIKNLVTQSDELRENELPENLIAIYQQLCCNGIEDKFAKRLVTEVKKKIPQSKLDNFSFVKMYVARMFMQVLNVDAEPLKSSSQWGPKILTFLGPTGVGKTTTLAKIAGSQKIANPSLKIGMITIDTFRIAAVQQLQEYARIIKVPVRVVNDHRQLNQALSDFKDKDLVLIDTAGRSQRDELQMSELRELLKDYSEFNNLLVLSATTKDSDLIEITKRFSTVPLSGVIFTKLDESTNYGSIFNHAIRFKLPLEYLTTGQNVPDDIEMASRERLIDLLLNISGELD